MNNRKILKTLYKNKLATVGLLIVFTLVVLSVFAPAIAPHDPIEQDYSSTLLPPLSENHSLGTDALGRDILSRTIYGTRYALLIGVAVVSIEVLIGMLLGLTAGFYGGVIDNILMRLNDVMLAIPTIVLALAIAGALGGGITNMIIAIGVSGWREFARLARGTTLSIKEYTYIESARSIGASNLRIIARHIMPNLVGPVIVFVSLYIPFAILWSAALSFLGLGAQPPLPEWGAIIAGGRDYLATAWWIATFPGLAIMVTVLGFNFLGDGLRDALDPRLRGEN
jgi:peptide/nickel transport system permease protein